MRELAKGTQGLVLLGLADHPKDQELFACTTVEGPEFPGGQLPECRGEPAQFFELAKGDLSTRQANQISLDSLAKIRRNDE